MVEDTARVCMPTHNTNIAIAGAAAVAAVISSALVGRDLDGLEEAFFTGVREGMKQGQPWTAASIEHRTRWALEIVRSERSEEDIWTELYNYIGTGVATTEAVPTAFALVIYYEADPWPVIRAAANIGGDCDTVGAIAGSMAGAVSGAASFPDQVAPLLEKVNQLDLAGYADRFIQRLDLIE